MYVYSCAPISMKFGTQVVLPRPYISKNFGMIRSETDKNMSDNR